MSLCFGKIVNLLKYDELFYVFYQRKFVIIYKFFESYFFIQVKYVNIIIMLGIRIGVKYLLICYVEFNIKLGMFLERGNKVIIIIIIYF